MNRVVSGGGIILVNTRSGVVVEQKLKHSEQVEPGGYLLRTDPRTPPRVCCETKHGRWTRVS